MNLSLNNPVVLVGAALLIGALVLMRPAPVVVPPPAPEAPPAPPAPTRQPGEETAARQRDIAVGERTLHDLQDSGELDASLDYDTREHPLMGEGAVVVGNPVQGERDNPIIHKYACTDDVYDPVMRYFWQTLQDTGAGFGWRPPDGSVHRYALVLVEHPHGTFNAPQLMPTAYLSRFPGFVQGWWVDPQLTAQNNGDADLRAGSILAAALGLVDRSAALSSMPADSVARMHLPSDRLARLTDTAGSGARLAGQPGVAMVTEHFPTWWIHHGEWLMRPSEIWARSICPRTSVGPREADGKWSLICASEQGKDLGGSSPLSSYVTPVPYLFNRGYNPVVDGDCTATERHLYSIAREYGPRRLARIHPKTGKPWRCFSFARSYEVPDNPAWSLVWWTPWYPQHRDDESDVPGEASQSFEPHLGGGSQASAGFVQWVTRGYQTGDKPAGQWIGNIPIGLPQDCVRIGERVKCDNRHAPDRESPCGKPDFENLWQIGYGSNSSDCPPPAVEAEHLDPATVRETAVGGASASARQFGGSITSIGFGLGR